MSARNTAALGAFLRLAGLSCGAVLPEAAVRNPDILTCAVHPTFQALGPCPRCGTFACGQCLVVLPDGQQICRACEAKGIFNLPWDKRGELGVVRAFFRTCFASIGKPTMTFAMAGPGGSVGSSALFAALSGLCLGSSTVAFYGVGVVLGTRLFGGNPETGIGERLYLSLAAVLGTLAFFVIYNLGLMFVGGSVEHVCLRFVGAQPKAWSVTMRAYALSLSPSLAGIVPYCSIYVVPIWSLVLRIMAYRALHGTTTGRATAGALLPVGAFVLLVLFVIGFSVMLIK